MSLKATLPEYWCVLLPAGSPFFLKQIRWTKKKELQSGPGSLLSRTPLREGDNGDVGYGDSSLLFRRCTPQLPIFPSSPGHQAWTTESLMKAHVWSANCRTEVGSCRKNPPLSGAGTTQVYGFLQIDESKMGDHTSGSKETKDLLIQNTDNL